tara:strand:+ start:2206 stop:2373 length:168 start_codon:yes stop_codon:yes gene_type:complete
MKKQNTGSKERFNRIFFYFSAAYKNNSAPVPIPQNQPIYFFVAYDQFFSRFNRRH